MRNENGGRRRSSVKKLFIMKVTNKPKEKTEDEHGTEMSNWMRARENNEKQRISWTSKDWSNFIFCCTFFCSLGKICSSNNKNYEIEMHKHRLVLLSFRLKQMGMAYKRTHIKICFFFV